MNLDGEYIRKVTNDNGDIEITFVLKDYYSKRNAGLLEREKLYSIGDKVSKRSLNQNALMWELISRIANQIGEEDINVYCEALEKAGAKYIYLQAVSEAEEELRNTFRAIKVLETFENEKGNKIKTLKCYYGSSKMNTKEMNRLLEVVQDIAYKVGVEINDY